MCIELDVNTTTAAVYFLKSQKSNDNSEPEFVPSLFLIVLCIVCKLIGRGYYLNFKGCRK